MSEYASIRNQRCPNPFCRFHGQALAGNVIVHSQTARRMRCKACRKTWVTRRHEVTYGLRTAPETVSLGFALLKVQMSIRQVANEIQVSPSTVQRWKNRFKNQFIP